MTLDTLQTRFVDEIVNGSGHLVLTGKAGTGKSTALCAAVDAAIKSGKDVALMAPTAMAASIHRDHGLESGTIHHALKWNPARQPLTNRMLVACSCDTDWNAAPDKDRLLIVDEASMVSLWLFEILARDLGEPERPFDGRRLVLVGDWAQLPPVLGYEEMRHAKAMPELRNFGPPDGCVLYHHLFRRQTPTAIVLEESHRANTEWFEKLNRLRELAGASTLGRLGMKCATMSAQQTSDEHIHLCFRRSVAHHRNGERLARLNGRPSIVHLRDGDMELKEGCRVIVTSNRSGGAYINGSRAVFAGMGDDGSMLLDDGVPIHMLADGNWGHAYFGRNSEVDEAAAEKGRHKASWLLSQYDGDIMAAEALKWLEQIIKPENAAMAARFAEGQITFEPYWPVIPGYAITVHKAQGMTLPNALVEDDVFWSQAPARLPYVALSRVPDESNVALCGFGVHSAQVRSDPSYPPLWSRILKWSANHDTTSNAAG